MEHFAMGFAVAVFAAAFLIYFANKLKTKQDNSKGPDIADVLPKTEGEPEKDCFLIIFDKEAKVLRSPKYKHQIEGPMAIDVYQWITGKKEDIDGSDD
jgi:hypothetical protein